MANVQTAMLLAAGKGERLRPLTEHTPKPLIEVRGKRLLAHQLDWLRDAGIRNVVINLHHLGEQISEFCGGGEAYGLNIRYSWETELLETGGGIVNALPLLGDEPFLLMNGDIFTNFPLASLCDLPDWADAHLLVTAKPDYRAQGDFEFADGRITRRGESYVYCGIALLRPSLFKGATTGAFSLRDLFFRAIDEKRISAQVHTGYWIDIGSAEQLEAVNSAAL